MADKIFKSVTLPDSGDVYINNPESTAEQFSASKAYTAGEMVFYNRKLYKFTADHAAGAWNAAHAVEVTVGSEMADILSDVTDLKADINNKPDYIYDTASGAIASFSDGADSQPITSLVASIEPVQSGSGDPSPDNVRPITGWTGLSVVRCGKNLNPYEGVNFSTYTHPNGFWMHKGDYTFSLDTGGIFGSGNNIYIQLKDIGGNVITKGNISGSGWTLTNTEDFYYGGGGNAITQISFHLNVDCFFNFGFNNTSPTANGVQLELGSTATAYAPYTGQTISVTWETEAGTVYGGTLDVVSGELTATHRIITLDDTNWTWNIGNWGSGYRYWSTQTVPDALSVQTCMTSIYKKGASIEGAGISIDTAVQGKQVDVRTVDFDTLEDWKAYVAENPVQCVYQLATPQTYQLTPQEVTTLLGQNNISVDTGNVSVTYPADTKKYIAKVFAELSS